MQNRWSSATVTPPRDPSRGGLRNAQSSWNIWIACPTDWQVKYSRQGPDLKRCGSMWVESDWEIVCGYSQCKKIRESLYVRCRDNYLHCTYPTQISGNLFKPTKWNEKIMLNDEESLSRSCKNYCSKLQTAAKRHLTSRWLVFCEVLKSNLHVHKVPYPWEVRALTKLRCGVFQIKLVIWWGIHPQWE